MESEAAGVVRAGILGVPSVPEDARGGTSAGAIAFARAIKLY